MSSDVERMLRDAESAIPEPGDVAREHVERAVFGADRVRATRRRVERPGLVVVAAAAALLGAGLLGGVGIALAIGPRDAPVGDAGPGFLPARGWTTVSTGAVPATDGPTAIATNGPLVAEPGPIGKFPTQTIAQLPVRGILIFATLGARGENANVDARFPPARLPFRVADAFIDPRWEGQPREEILQRRLRGAVGSWNVDVRVYIGTPMPAAEVVREAQEALERLVLPTS